MLHVQTQPMNDVVGDYEHPYMWHQKVWLATISIVKTQDYNQVLIGGNSCGSPLRSCIYAIQLFTSTATQFVVVPLAFLRYIFPVFPLVFPQVKSSISTTTDPPVQKANNRLHKYSPATSETSLLKEHIMATTVTSITFLLSTFFIFAVLKGSLIARYCDQCFIQNRDF